jgi:tRNA (cytidine56-2'-O)-methyltransferase
LRAEKSIRVLRLGHRFVRDDRTMTHLCLVSRALGAEGIFLEEADPGLVEKIEEVNRSWGGEFLVSEERSWEKVIRRAKDEGRTVVHLTMYGLPLQDKVEEMRKHTKYLIVVGGPKVPGEVYRLADYNISITNQPHSEIAALAILMHALQEGEELKREFKRSRLRIIPREKGKQVELKS